MHELAITESIVSSVAERVAGRRVTRVVLEIGRLSGVVPDAVRFCFDLCAEGTELAGASLDIVQRPGRACCRTCGQECEFEDPLALCGCGSADLDVREGQELRIREVEVV
jgi:hydrogenase nickel incorporation protein HypA/HybF